MMRERYGAGAALLGVAGLLAPRRLYRVARAHGKIYADGYEGVIELQEKQQPRFAPDCETPFVYLYDVSDKNSPSYTFPTTRKALSSFAGAADLQLLEFKLAKQRRLGVAVKSKAQGEALLAHVKATMKDEAPYLLCFQPDKPRVIDMHAK